MKNKENKYVELAYELIDLFIDDKSLSTIKILESIDYDYEMLILVDEKSFGKVIGYKGNIANSIRNILKAYAYKNNEKIKIEFESF